MLTILIVHCSYINNHNEKSNINDNNVLNYVKWDRNKITEQYKDLKVISLPFLKCVLILLLFIFNKISTWTLDTAISTIKSI